MRKGLLNLIEQPEHCGIDYFGNEVLVGDEVVEFRGEFVLKENLEEFLVGIGFEFKTAK